MNAIMLINLLNTIEYPIGVDYIDLHIKDINNEKIVHKNVRVYKNDFPQSNYWRTHLSKYDDFYIRDFNFETKINGFNMLYGMKINIFHPDCWKHEDIHTKVGESSYGN